MSISSTKGANFNPLKFWARRLLNAAIGSIPTAPANHSIAKDDLGILRGGKRRQ
jgi:hypothetical protein